MIATQSGPKTVDVQGPLPGTWLEDWHPVKGGWAATICSDALYDSEKYIAAQKTIASAFRMHRSMLTLLPDPEDETRCMIFAQRNPPIRDAVPWPGPASVDGPAGKAFYAMYADGKPLHYELYRRGWGVPHDAFFGSTGSGKSQAACMAFVIDRWAHHVDPTTGLPRGMVASFLIDHQEGQSFAPFLNDLAAPVAVELPEAQLLVEALHREAKRRNRYLAREVRWTDKKRGIERVGRDWWDPLVDGPILTLTVDEAHEPLRDSKFAQTLTSAARMWRKCGLKVRLITQMSQLGDMGGSSALRDMLIGGFVWMGRVNNGTSAQLALNGRTHIDPRHIPPIPGTAGILTAADPRGMLARTAWMPDWYDALYDENNEPIGYPAQIPEETWAAFGDEFRGWCEYRRTSPGEMWVPPSKATPIREEPTPTCLKAVADVLLLSPEPLDADGLVAGLRKNGHGYSVRTVREALAKLRKAEVATKDDQGRHSLHPRILADADEEFAQRVAAMAA